MSRHSIILFCLLAVFCLAPPLALAQEIEVQASVSQENISLGEMVEYEIHLISNQSRPDTRQIQLTTPPTFVGLRPMREAPMVRQMTEIVNNAVTARVVLSWQLLPEREGKAVITAGQLDYKGQKHSLPRFDILVKKNAVDVLPEELAQANILPARSGNAQIDKQLRGKLFAQLHFSNREPYLQETIVVNCTIYTDGFEDIVGQVGWEAPEWNAFFSEEIDLGDLRWQPVTIGDRRYQAVTIQRLLLTPTKAGKVEIPLSAAQCKVRVQDRGRRSFEDRFFNLTPGMGSLFDNYIDVRLPIASQSIQVKPLPSEGRPPSFQNAVGAFSVAGSIDRREMNQDDLLTLRVEIGGEGFLGSIATPTLPPFPDWREVGTQSDTELAGTAQAHNGKKIFEFLLRPRKTGSLSIPEIPYAFFDPKEKRYVEQVIGPFAIDVARAEKRDLVIARSGESRLQGGGPEFFGEKLAYIHPDPPVPKGKPFHKTWLFSLALVFSLLLIAASVTLRWWQTYRVQNADRFRRQAADSEARRELRLARKRLRQGDSDAFHQCLADALRQYVALKTNRSAAGLTLDQVESLCLQQGASKDVANRLRQVLEKSDAARFLAASAEAQEADLNEAALLLKELDRVFSAAKKGARK